MPNLNTILRELICWEDMETFLLVGLTEDGKIEVNDYSGEHTALGDSFEEAVFNYYNDKKTGRKNLLGRALGLAYRNTVDPEFKRELDTWMTELGIEER